MTSEERLERLEKELALTKRRLRRLVQGVICLFAVGGVFAVLLYTTGAAKAQGEKVIRANKFILVDQSGKQRGVLGMTDDQPRLAFFDQDGMHRAVLGVVNGIPGLAFFDQDGKTRAVLGVMKERPDLAFFDQNGRSRARLMLVDGMPKLLLKDQTGNARAALHIGNEGPNLVLFDKNGRVRTVMGSKQTTSRDGKTITYPESSLLLFSPEGKLIWQAP